MCVSKGFIDERGSGNAMVIEPYTILELEKVIKTIKSKSSKIDGLSFKALKAVANYLLPSILFLTNLSMEKGQFPDALKQARVIPLHRGWK